MSKNRKLVRAIQNFYQQFCRQSPSTAKQRSLWLLRSFIVTKKRPEWVNSGFVLPTVAMVSLVVVLLTIAILFRSFERSKNANNVRVNQAVLNAAMPAIDRAKAKIDKLFTDPTLPRSTPSDTSLYNAFTNNLAKYTFGDETPLEVRYDIDGSNSIDDDEELENREAIRTAWRFPVDTDNNGKFDSFTVYGVFFRSPSRGDDGKFDRARTPLGARTPPMDDGSLGGLCAAAKGTSASLIGNSGWYKSGSTIKKSFFVYAATVPITDTNATSLYGSAFEQHKGNKGFSAVEYQQDTVRVPLLNNAVVYEDDLEIAPGGGLKLNGRVFTNSNLLTAQTVSGSGREIVLYQVSSPKSCFYQAQNSKIIVGGNVGYGNVIGSGTRGGTQVHLFKPSDTGGTKKIDTNNRSVRRSAGDIAFNSQAYSQRIDGLVELQTIKKTNEDPTEVRENIKSRMTENSGLDREKIRREELEIYFKKRTRKVPFYEVPFGGEAGTASLQGSGDTLRAQDSWIYPFSPTNNNDTYTRLKIELRQLEATEPNRLKEIFREEERYIGDRVVVGNNLPALWFDKNIEDFVGVNTPQDVLPKTKWTDPGDDEESQYRYRKTQIQQLISLDGASKRDGFFELKASEKPVNPLDNVGGMRIVTGAGIYVDDITYKRKDNSFLPEPEWDKNFVDPANTSTTKVKVTDLKLSGNDPIIVWPDSMPMRGRNQAGIQRQGDLVMRATAVYHYTQSNGKEQTPIACISSYHDPTNAVTAQNRSDLNDVPNSIGAAPRATSSNSHNGIVYQPPYTGSRQSAYSSFKTKLEQQARLVFPNGRFVNEPLRNAVLKNGNNLSMTESSAVDTAICAIKIEDGTLTRNQSLIQDGTIYETSFLDARQVKALEATPNIYDNGVDPDYTLALEQRQPLEIRVTVLDLDKLRRKKISGGLRQEYLIPNSGIIYATRDDALEDLSYLDNDLEKRKLLSPTDYKVDPTRRPNGIMLINGKHIHRELEFREEEKGLILVTNVPAYIKGDFNLHAKGGNANVPVEEFTLQLRDQNTGEINWSQFYNRTTLDDNFACRKNDPRLPSSKCRLGDSWRPATVVADAITVLSENFRFGFRNEGDYDLRNNTGNSVSAIRRKLGFFDNNYLTSAPWFKETGSNSEKGFPKDFDSSKSGIQGSSYVNNFVTPIQRRVKFGEYVMEMCRKLPVETCGPDDWVVQDTETKASEIAIGTDVDDLDSGTTAKLAENEEDRRYSRRVAFLRDPDTNKLILDNKNFPVPIGIDSSGQVQYYPYGDLELPLTDGKFDPSGTPTKIDAFSSSSSSNRPRNQDNALWFQTANDSNFDPDDPIPKKTNYGHQYPLFFLNELTKNDKPSGAEGNWGQGGLEQPILVPVLQIYMPADSWTRNDHDPGTSQFKIPDSRRTQGSSRGIATDKNWLPEATHTTTNLVLAQGDTPPRVSSSNKESNGGLENFVRYLETWTDLSDSSGNTRFNHSLSGSLIQYKRSAYATAPWQAILNNPRNSNNLDSDFGKLYEINITDGKSPFYTPPQRQWGFDVALLSQIPDLFAQQFTLPTAGKPNEFFRELSRDDDWVKTLLCAKVLTIDSSNNVSLDSNKNAVSENQRPTKFCKDYAGN